MQRIVLLFLLCSACHHARLEHPQTPALELTTLHVSSGELQVAAARAGARVTILIEHPLHPSRGPSFTSGQLPDADMGPIYVYLLLDRRDQLISVAGPSYRHPEQWQARMNTVPERTGEELDADLQVIIDTVQLLRSDPHGTEEFQRELGDMLRTAKELKGLRAPKDSVRCDLMTPPTCEQR
ncbi:MAG: hypothetical protein QM778_18815 [Myxococcales bacterium]